MNTHVKSLYSIWKSDGQDVTLSVTRSVEHVAAGFIDFVVLWERVDRHCEHCLNDSSCTGIKIRLHRIHIGYDAYEYEPLSKNSLKTIIMDGIYEWFIPSRIPIRKTTADVIRTVF